MTKRFLVFFLFMIGNVYAQEGTIFEIARKGSVAQMKQIVESEKKALHQKNQNGHSALMLACYANNNAVAHYLIEKGADCNDISADGSVLMAAVVKNNLEIGKKILEQKIDVNAQDANGNTALIYAVQFGNLEFVKLLLQYKAHTQIQNKEGKTAVELALVSNHQEIIQLLK